MDRELYTKLRRLDARATQLEDSFQEMAAFLSEMEEKSKQANDELCTQVNVALKEIDKRFSELEQKIKDLDNRFSTHVRDYMTDMEEVEDALADPAQYKFGVGTKSQRLKSEKGSK